MGTVNEVGCGSVLVLYIACIKYMNNIISKALPCFEVFINTLRLS